MGKKLNLQWVSDVIGNDYKKWRKGDVVSIKAQTGTGKTWFIKNKLIPYMEDWESMLIVVNRTNLKRQLKIDLFNYYNQPIPDNLDDARKIGNVTILSYQKISEMKNGKDYGLKEFNIDHFDYIVCDECHFFLSDSGFNNKTDLAFEALIRERHRNAVKIFISATMDEIEKAIENGFNNSLEEWFGTGKNKYWPSKLYDTGIDYSYVDCKYFKSINDVTTLIKNDKSEDKWLVFVTKKSDANDIKERLEGIHKCEIITKDTKTKDSEDLQSIINESKFKSKVLICTKAMDNGINIEDETVKNIVIMAYDKVTFIQELGRVRQDIENAYDINLYIPTFSWSSFNTLINIKYEPKKDDIKLFEEDYNKFCNKYDRNLDKLHKDIFYRHKDGSYKINPNGYCRLIKDDLFAKEMLENYKVFDKYAYVLKQLEWLDLTDTFSVDKLIEDVVDDEEVCNLEQYLSNLFDNKVVMLQAKDRTELIKNIGLIDGHNSNIKKDKIKYIKNIETLNAHLKGLKSSYRIKEFETSRISGGKKKNYKNAWNIEKTISY